MKKTLTLLRKAEMCLTLNIPNGLAILRNWSKSPVSYVTLQTFNFSCTISSQKRVISPAIPETKLLGLEELELSVLGSPFP